MNNYNPRLTILQQIEYLSKYRSIQKKLKPLCEWVDFRDYIWSYNSIDWKDKIVLDIGADIGSSALYFLINGAYKVFLLESDLMYQKIYKNIASVDFPALKYSTCQILENPKNLNAKSLKLCDEVDTLNSFVRSEYFDVLKMDCEGCELQLLTEDLIKRSREFVVGLHKPQLDDYQFEQKKSLLEKYGGKYYGSVNNEEFVWIKRLAK